LSIFAVKPTFIGGVWIVLIPAVYILFSAVAGITVNLALPVMKWDNETKVVKQSASGIVTMLVSFISILLPVIALFALKNVSVNLIMGATLLILSAVTGLLYARNNRKQLLLIE
jgi:ABC-2 type transport system permease protein